MTKKIILSVLAILLITNFLMTKLQAQQPVKVESSEVLLDIIARDKKGNFVKDLKPDEIEITEDGIKQSVTNFRLLDGASIAESEEVGSVKSTKKLSFDPARQMRLVTMVFDSLSTNDSRRLAQHAALDFLESQLQPNTLVCVYTANRRAYAVQEFTNDREKLRAAILKITGTEYKKFAETSNQIRDELQKFVRTTQEARPTGGALANQAPDIGKQIEAQQSRLMLNMLTLADSAQRDIFGRTSLYALLALVRGQKSLQARKTMLYIAEGMHISADSKDIFDTLRSEANRANVSIYSIDARGLNSSGNGAGAGLIGMVGATSQAMMTSGGDGMGFGSEQMVMDATVSDSQGLMRDLSESTGGFLIANTNDARKAMQKVAADIAGYYEVFYAPQISSYDGRFRKIVVKTSRPGITLQTRNGYFAVPPTPDGVTVMGYEMPMLAALNAETKPHAFDYKVAKLRFDSTAEGVQQRIILETSANNFTFKEDAAKKTYRSRFSVLAVVKDANGQIVQKLGQTFPLAGTLDRLPLVKAANVVYLRDLNLAPGRYSLETAWFDHETNKISAATEVLFIPDSKAALKMSSLVVIKKTEVVKPAENQDDPLIVGQQKITAFVGEVGLTKENARLPLYFKIYSAPENKTPIKAELRIYQDGKLLGGSPLELPAADAAGHIAHIVTLPLENLAAGKYDLRIVAMQGQDIAQERLFVTMK